MITPPVVTPADRTLAVKTAKATMNGIRGTRGMVALLARALVTPDTNVTTWVLMPLHHVFKAAAALQVKPEQLRPDFFLDDPARHERARTATPVKPPAKLVYLHPYRDVPLAEHLRRLWLNPVYPTDQEAADAISAVRKGTAVMVRTIVNQFGPSGR